MASGLNSTFRLLGIAIGVAALGALLEHRVEQKLAELLPNAPSGLADIVATGNVEAAAAAAPPGAESQVASAAQAAFVYGLDEIFIAAAVIAFAGAALALALVRQKDITSGQGAPPAAG